MKEVSDGYARNYLLPRKLASEATADALNAFKLKEKAKAAQMAKEKALAEENAKRLSGVVVQISRARGPGRPPLRRRHEPGDSRRPARAARHRAREEQDSPGRAHKAVRQLRGQGQARLRGLRHHKRPRDGEKITSREAPGWMSCWAGGRRIPRQAEQAVLGSMLIDPRCIPEVIGKVKSEDFYIQTNREIFETMFSMFSFGRNDRPRHGHRRDEEPGRLQG